MIQAGLQLKTLLSQLSKCSDYKREPVFFQLPFSIFKAIFNIKCKPFEEGKLACKTKWLEQISGVFVVVVVCFSSFVLF